MRRMQTPARQPRRPSPASPVSFSFPLAAPSRTKAPAGLARLGGEGQGDYGSAALMNMRANGGRLTMNRALGLLAVGLCAASAANAAPAPRHPELVAIGKAVQSAEL